MYCLACHYDLGGSVEAGRCPECGREFDGGEPSSYARGDEQRLLRIGFWFLGASALVPGVMYLLVHLVWVVGFIFLGYGPRAGLDDPSEISVLFSLLYYPTVFLMALMLPLSAGVLLLMVVAILTIRDREFHSTFGRRVFWVVSGLAGWSLGLVILRTDVTGVLNWLMD